MTLLVDADGDGEFGALEVFDACLPFEVGGVTYEASATPDGARLTFTPTTRTAQVVKPPVRAAPPKDSGLLAAGTPAPDFTADRFGGGALKLSDLRGKVVVLDFWATWCIPCIRSMPHVQKTVAKATGDEVVWLGVCVWDDRDAFDRWVPANDAKYSFTKVFDPAAKDKAASIAGRLYKVTGIPTLYVLGRDGRVVEGLVGYLGDDDDRLAQALRKAGLRL
jgi:thiol-disulfide isomerase/thioredoxin